MEDFFDDDFIDDILEEDCDEMDLMEEDILGDTDNSLDVENTPEPVISFEDFLFRGGFLGINIDEERMERHRKKKKKEFSCPAPNI